MMLERVCGTREGLCAWCNDPSQTSYVGEEAGGTEVEYEVCLSCYEERN